MVIRKIYIFIYFTLFLLNHNLLAQQDTIVNVAKDSLYIQGNIKTDTYTSQILSPAKSAFYAAILPGLGQAYNKQYWKIPLVYGAIGAGLYFYQFNNNEYLRYRTAYFNRQNGLPDEFPEYQADVLIKAQKYYKRQRDTALMLTVLAYFLNIVDANVSAHLKQWNVDDNLSLSPSSFQVDTQHALGLKLVLKSNF